MSYKNSDIDQAIATVNSKLALRSYSGYLRKIYGMFNGPCLHREKLLLLRFVLNGWDNRAGAINNITEASLGKIIREINSL